jgi:cytochrome P450 family 9
MVQDADILKNIMVKDFDYFVDRDHQFTNKIYKTQQKAGMLWMEQLTSAQGDKWKSIRSTFTPIFTSGKMKAQYVFVQETCKKLIAAMEDFAEKDEAFELKAQYSSFTEWFYSTRSLLKGLI